MAAIVYIFPNFENYARYEKDLKDNKDNSLHLGRKYAQIFASLSEICSLLGTDNVRRQISEHIFTPNVTIVYCFNVKWRLLCLLSFKFFSQERSFELQNCGRCENFSLLGTDKTH